MTDGRPLLRPPAAAHRYSSADLPVRGGTLHTGIWDPEPGIPPAGTFLAIHGITAVHLAWQWLAAALPAWRIIAPDLRGRGHSNALPPPFGLRAHAADLARLLIELGETDPLPVAGHSMGGFVGLVLAHRYPARVRNLLLVDGGIPVERPPGVGPTEVLTAVLKPSEMRLRMEFASLDAVDDYWRHHPGLASQWGPEMAAYAAYDTVGQAPQLQPSTRYPAMADDSLDIETGADLPTAIAELAHPAHFLRAERGLQDEPQPLFTREWADQCAARTPQLTLQDLPNTNHFTIIMSAAGSARVAEALG